VIGPQTSWYRQALGSSHKPYVRVEVWRGVALLASTAPVYGYEAREFQMIDGSVRCSLNSRVTRSLTITVPEEFYPDEESDFLAPYGNHIHAYRGIEHGDGTVDEFPVFRGPIRSIAPNGDGRATLRAEDLAGEVVAASFPNPQVAQVGTLIVDEFERLVLDAVPDAEFGTHSALADLVPPLNYDYDRGAALDQLAKASSSFWYAQADGRFVLRRVPWTVSSPTLTTLTSGDGGTLLKAYPQRDASGLFNVVTVTSERADGSVPLSWTARDDDPTSVTYYLGAYGLKARQVKLSTATSSSQVKSAAETFLRASLARTESWQAQCVPDASIELGDTLGLSYRGRDGVVQVVIGIDMPLLPTGNMALSMRAQVAPVVDAEEEL
jgi:hypothetical protein